MAERRSPKPKTRVRFLASPPLPRRSFAPQNEGGIRLATARFYGVAICVRVRIGILQRH